MMFHDRWTGSGRGPVVTTGPQWGTSSLGGVAACMNWGPAPPAPPPPRVTEPTFAVKPPQPKPPAARRPGILTNSRTEHRNMTRTVPVEVIQTTPLIEECERKARYGEILDERRPGGERVITTTYKKDYNSGLVGHNETNRNYVNHPTNYGTDYYDSIGGKPAYFYTKNDRYGTFRGHDLKHSGHVGFSEDEALRQWADRTAWVDVEEEPAYSTIANFDPEDWTPRTQLTELSSYRQDDFEDRLDSYRDFGYRGYATRPGRYEPLDKRVSFAAQRPGSAHGYGHRDMYVRRPPTPVRQTISKGRRVIAPNNTDRWGYVREALEARRKAARHIEEHRKNKEENVNVSVQCPNTTNALVTVRVAGKPPRPERPQIVQNIDHLTVLQ